MAERTRTYSWSDPVAARDAGIGLDGLAVLEAIREGKIPPPPLGATLDFGPAEFAAGQAVFTLDPQEFHYNPIGSVHGGVICTLLDSACGCAVHTMLRAGEIYTSLDLSVKFLRPITVETGALRAEGSVTYIGRRTALADARLFDAGGKLYATATSSCVITR